MRDPNRISRIIKKFEASWIQHPDLRFCQLTSNVGFDIAKSMDIFYVEDDKFEKMIDEYLGCDCEDKLYQG